MSAVLRANVGRLPAGTVRKEQRGRPARLPAGYRCALLGNLEDARLNSSSLERLQVLAGGTPPRVRGPLHYGHREFLDEGNTPACAGATSRRPPRAPTGPEHPRVRGGHSSLPASLWGLCQSLTRCCGLRPYMLTERNCRHSIGHRKEQHRQHAFLQEPTADHPLPPRSAHPPQTPPQAGVKPYGCPICTGEATADRRQEPQHTHHDGHPRRRPKDREPSCRITPRTIRRRPRPRRSARSPHRVRRPASQLPRVPGRWFGTEGPRTGNSPARLGLRRRLRATCFFGCANGVSERRAVPQPS